MLWLLLTLLLSKLAGEQKGSVPLMDQARTRLAKAAVVLVFFSDLYLHNGLQLFYLFFKDLCNQISSICRC